MMTPTKSKLCNPGELKMPRQSRYFLFLLPLALAACSSMPSGPNVMVLPGKGVSFEQFRADDLLCRQYAASQTGTNSNDAAINSGVKSAALGTALGAAGGAGLLFRRLPARIRGGVRLHPGRERRLRPRARIVRDAEKRHGALRTRIQPGISGRRAEPR